MRHTISLPAARSAARSAYVNRQLMSVYVSIVLVIILLVVSALVLHNLVVIGLIVVAGLVWRQVDEQRRTRAKTRFVECWDEKASVRIDHGHDGTETLIVNSPTLGYTYRKLL